MKRHEGGNDWKDRACLLLISFALSSFLPSSHVVIRDSSALLCSANTQEKRVRELMHEMLRASISHNASSLAQFFPFPNAATELSYSPFLPPSPLSRVPRRKRRREAMPKTRLCHLSLSPPLFYIPFPKSRQKPTVKQVFIIIYQ